MTELTPELTSELTPELDLFIVHAEADAGFVRGYLLPALELPRDRVLLVDELPLGGLIVSEIDRGVSRSRYTVAVLSPAFLEDRWAAFGAELASHVGRPAARVIPLRLVDCEPPVWLDARVALDFRDADRWAWETARLHELLYRPPDERVRLPERSDRGAGSATVRAPCRSCSRARRSRSRRRCETSRAAARRRGRPPRTRWETSRTRPSGAGRPRR